MKAAICSQCGGALEIDEDKEYGFCPNCGTKYYTEKIICQDIVNKVENNYYINASETGAPSTVTEKRIFDETLTPETFRRAVLKRLVEEFTPADVVREARFGNVRKGVLHFVRYCGGYTYEWEGEREETEGEHKHFHRVRDTLEKQFDEMRIVGEGNDKSLLKKFREEYLSLPSHVPSQSEIAEYSIGGGSVLLQNDRDYIASLKDKAKAQIPYGVRNVRGDFRIADDRNTEYYMPYYSVEYTYKGQSFLASSVAAKEAVEMNFPAPHNRPKYREDKISLVSLILSVAFLIAALVIANAVEEGNPVYVLSNVFVAVMAVGIIVCIVRYGTRKKQIAESNRAQKQKDFDDLTNS